jgi:two-component system, sensor histidine kinase and response regulator
MQEGLAGALTDKQGHYLNRMKANIERVTRMINDLLNLTRIEAGQIEIRLQSVSMSELIDHLLEGFEPTTRQKHLSLKANYEAGLPAAQCDPDKVTQILTNLIQNAIKFTPSGGDIRVEVETGEGQFMRICVADTGCGIPSSELHRVFDKFYRGSSAQSEARGTGLGLAITKHLVQLQQGTIWVESRPSEGTRFFFTLPLSKT